jgi:excisionase family DNA binding protein
MNTNYRQIDDLPLSLRVDELMTVLDIGRNTAYAMLRSGVIRSVRIGRQIRIPRDALIEFLRGDTNSTSLP